MTKTLSEKPKDYQQSGLHRTHTGDQIEGCEITDVLRIFLLRTIEKTLKRLDIIEIGQ